MIPTSCCIVQGASSDFLYLPFRIKKNDIASRTGRNHGLLSVLVLFSRVFWGKTLVNYLVKERRMSRNLMRGEHSKNAGPSHQCLMQALINAWSETLHIHYIHLLRLPQGSHRKIHHNIIKKCFWFFCLFFKFQ